MKVVSQLGNDVTNMLRQRVPEAEFIAIPQEPPAALPADARMMIAAPPVSQAAVPRPDGWPFGLECLQLVSVASDLYPPWYLEVDSIAGMRGVSSDSIAEFVLALMFAASKRLPETWIDRAEQWQFGDRDMISGATLGIFGYGAIGQALAKRALALGMKVLAVRRDNAQHGNGAVEMVATIAELFARSDHVVLAAPATPATVGIVGVEVLAAAKPGLHLVNVARGSLIDDDALIDALDRGQIGLASLDVTHPEPLPNEHAFYSHPRVRLSPHVAPYTTETLPGLLERAGENVRRLMRNEPLIGKIDLARGY